MVKYSVLSNTNVSLCCLSNHVAYKTTSQNPTTCNQSTSLFDSMFATVVNNNPIGRSAVTFTFEATNEACCNSRSFPCTCTGNKIIMANTASGTKSCNPN